MTYKTFLRKMKYTVWKMYSSPVNLVFRITMILQFSVLNTNQNDYVWQSITPIEMP